MCFFAARISWAPAVKVGATIASTNCETIAAAASASTGTLSPITPPYAETGSVSRALPYASAAVSPSPTPQGLLCLMIAQAGVSNSATSESAASRSTMLLNESSFPWSLRAEAIDGPVAATSR